MHATSFSHKNQYLNAETVGYVSILSLGVDGFGVKNKMKRYICYVPGRLRCRRCDSVLKGSVCDMAYLNPRVKLRWNRCELAMEVMV